ncbi:MAG: proteasome accessory factor PafA2 family protein [Nanoarchaeota archaeon]
MGIRSLLEKKAISLKTFGYIPEYKGTRIFGTEHELGVVLNEKQDDYEKYSLGINLPGFVHIGGRIYEDSNHIEISTPETRNPFHLLLVEKAMELICSRGEYVHRLYKNNVDQYERSWGAHENYWTCASNDTLLKIVPFLVTRQIFTGAGWQRNGHYEISQRSDFISHVSSKNTVRCERGIICTREEEKNEKYRRVHFILNEGNMSEGAILLKVGTLACMLDLAEEEKLPKKLEEYNLGMAVNDLHSIALLTKNWKVTGMPNTNQALYIQRMCFDAVVQQYFGRDEATNFIINLWYDTLEKLEKDPMSLSGRLDWVTKKVLLETLVEEDSNISHYILNVNDMDYHDIDRQKGLFFDLQREGLIERYVSDNSIEEQAKEPPKDTRAYFRGKYVQKIRSRNKNKECYWNEWNYCPAENNAEKKFEIPDPFNTYEHLIPLIN